MDFHDRVSDDTPGLGGWRAERGSGLGFWLDALFRLRTHNRDYKVQGHAALQREASTTAIRHRDFAAIPGIQGILYGPRVRR